MAIVSEFAINKRKNRTCPWLTLGELQKKMAPAAILHDDGGGDIGVPLVDMASSEIERMRSAKDRPAYKSFPPACLSLLKSMSGNFRCVDCGDRNPQWAAVSYGALLCLQCSGHHRSLGVHVSCVRSLSMDDWSPMHVLQMLEGGNEQLHGFFTRHHLSQEALLADNPKKTNLSPENVTQLRYRTKAALFYRQQLSLHAERVLAAGPYQGRELSRRLKNKPRIEQRSSSSVE